MAGTAPRQKHCKILAKHKQKHRFPSTPARSPPEDGATRFGWQHLVGVHGANGPASKTLQTPCKTQAKTQVPVNPRPFTSGGWSYQVWLATPGRCSWRERPRVKSIAKTLQNTSKNMFLSTPARSPPEDGATRFGWQHLVGVHGEDGPASKVLQKPCKTQAKT